MKIEDLIQLLNNRLREFKLSRDYAKMSGDLERMNTADKEIIALGDTLYQLNLLAETSKSAAVKETTLTEVMTEGSVAVLGEYDITPYATDPLHEEKVMNILSKMGVMDTVERIDNYIKGKYLSSPVTGEMIMSAAIAYSVDTRLMMAIMEQDSRFGTVGLAVSTLNPGNVGNDDAGNIRTYESWQDGVTAVAEWLSRHRISQGIAEEIVDVITTATSTPATNISTSTPATSTNSGQATSTPSTSTSSGQATTTPVTNTSTSTTATSTPSTNISTSTPATSTNSGQATSTPSTSTSSGQATTTPVTNTSTSTTSTSTPSTATSTTQTIPITTTSTTTTATTTPVTNTSTSSGQATTPETIPVVTSTTTTTTTIPVMDTSTTTGATVISTGEIAPLVQETATTTAP